MQQSYATVPDFVAAFGLHEAVELSNLDDPRSTIIVEEPILVALTHAAGQIDLLLGAYYPVPIAYPWPTCLVTWTLDLARSRLERMRRRTDTKEDVKATMAQIQAVVDQCERGLAPLVRPNGDVVQLRTLTEPAVLVGEGRTVKAWQRDRTGWHGREDRYMGETE